MALQSMTWHIVPDCGLTLTNCNLQPSSDLDPTDYHDLREYEINNISISNRSFNDYDINQQQLRDSAMIENTINGAIQQQRESAENGTWKGSMSPLNNVTLQEGQRETAGIPDDAKYFEYLRPPPKLVNHFGTYEHVMKNITNAEDK